MQALDIVVSQSNTIIDWIILFLHAYCEILEVIKATPDCAIYA